MSIVALSPVAAEPPSPMITSVTPVSPTLDPNSSTSVHLSLEADNPSQDNDSSSGAGPSRGSLAGGGPHLGQDPCRRSKKPPPLHTTADWKVVLHLPEIETWLRATSDRVTQLTHSVGQDSDGRHVDVHLVQLKDICEDISDHVEQIHALLETEFSLKLLSYSVNIIVDIRTVQLLWHQLRVSVLVLKERLLRSLQDSNGNFTRQTDILQAFSEDQHQTRLDALTEVDDCGKLTIRCSQDYFSLDCGITAYELSDYSPGDEPEGRGGEPKFKDPAKDSEQTQNSNQELAEENKPSHISHHKLQDTLPELIPPGDSADHCPAALPVLRCGILNSDSAKRPLQGLSHSAEVSPTQPSLPKRAALFLNEGNEDSKGGLGKVSRVSGLQIQAELSRSTPSLMDPPDRSKFWLELDSVYPENISQSCESLQVKKRKQRNLFRQAGGSPRPQPDPRSSFGTQPTANAPPSLLEPVSQDNIPKHMEEMHKDSRELGEGDSDSSLPSPLKEQYLSSDMEASGEESDPRPPPSKTAVWIVKRQGHKDVQVSSNASPSEELWYGSEEFLALPEQLRKTEMLAMKLENLAHSVNRPGDSTQEALQDVDDWELTELNPDWDIGENSVPSPAQLLPYKRNLISQLSSTSSSDVAPSSEDSIESGPLSDLQSDDDEGRRSADRHLQLTAPPVDRRAGASLVLQLLEDIQSQDKDPDVWKKIECFVRQLDGFILWLQEALDSTENWTQPRQEVDSLRVYLDTHLSFKLNVDSHSALKESIMEEGRALLPVITSHQSGLKDILHMVSSQWDQLQRQIRRQHSWMLRALRCIQARLLYTDHQSHDPFTASGEKVSSQQTASPADSLKAELVSSQCRAQRSALEQMAVKLSSLQYSLPSSGRPCSQLIRNNSLQEFEHEYQELWDWLMDMDAMVTDSHHLMMSEEQRHHLFKSSHTELMMMESKKTSLLGRAESLKRSATELPGNFHCKIHNLTHTWRQLEKILSEHSGPPQNQSGTTNSSLLGVPGVGVESPRSSLSPLTNSLLGQLEARIKELKAWLRDTELLIFNSCLREHRDVSQQLRSFKSLCSEVRARRRGVSSVLKLCQKLLQQSQSGPTVEVGPEAEQHREALQLLSINLERRWEAIVMQALQWQNRLKRELGEQQVPGNFLEPGLVDLHQMSPVPVAPLGHLPDDSWEWDETDMTITEPEPQEVPIPDLMHDLPTEPNLYSDSVLSGPAASVRPELMPSIGDGNTSSNSDVTSQNLPSKSIYQVYSLHTVELYKQPQLCQLSLLHKSEKWKNHLVLKSLSKDSSFSSLESLPDLLGGLSDFQSGDKITGSMDGDSRGSGLLARSRRSESESGIVSDTGETETTTTSSEVHGDGEEEGEGDPGEEEGNTRNNRIHEVGGSKQRRITTVEKMKEKGWRRNERRRHRRGGSEAVEILISGRGIQAPTDSDSEFEVGVNQFPTVVSHQVSSPITSQASSLESILGVGEELFPSKEPLHRSTSLESSLVLSTDGELEGGESGQQKKNGSAEQEPTSGELSRRTLDLLKRLENIQTPLTMKMTRSISDMMLRSSSPQRSRLQPSPSLGGSSLCRISGSCQKGPSLINECSAAASLTELTGTEDSSLDSDGFTMLRNQQHLLCPSTAINANSNSYRRHCPVNRRVGLDEADAASLSLLVNISCTDEDEDDSDLLSSSTLTLTEEELGVGKDEEESLSSASSGNEQEEEEELEGSYILGLDYMKKELQSWIRSPRTSSSLSKTEAGLLDELRCGSNLSSSFTSTFTPSSQNTDQQCFPHQTAAKSMEANMNSGNQREHKEKKNLRNATSSYISQFVDDVENGNVDHSSFKGRDEDDELLREESSVFIKKGESLRDSYVFAKTAESVQDVNGSTAKSESDPEKELSSSASCETLPFLSKRASSLVGQLKGELPCHSSSLPSPTSLSPVEDCRSHDPLKNSALPAGGRKAITIQEKFKFSSFVTEQTKKEVRDKESSVPPKKHHISHPSCCSHLPSPSPLQPFSVDKGKKENVHDFVMEIIDMTSMALRDKEGQPEEPNQNRGSVPDQRPASLTQIRDKVLQHAHRPLHLRKGDFYSYLSLSSHDSDCGEVTQCSEEKSSTPLMYCIPTYPTPMPGLHSPSPDLFTSTRKQPSASRRSSDGFHGLGLKSAEIHHSEDLKSPDIRDEETLFAACTEEVYLGPPLCYSMTATKKPHQLFMKETPECFSSLYPDQNLYSPTNSSDSNQVVSEGFPSNPDDSLSLSKVPESERNQGPTDETQRNYYTTSSTSLPSTSVSLHQAAYETTSSPPPQDSGAEEKRRGEDPSLLCTVAHSNSMPKEERSRNEGPPYLNPRALVAPIDSAAAAAKCSADSKTLESNMGAVMTKISVCSSATNPSKEPTATATHINPKINCSPMREADREEERRGRSASQQEAAETEMSSRSVVHHTNGKATGWSQASMRPPTPRAGTVSRLPVLGTRIQL